MQLGIAIGFIGTRGESAHMLSLAGKPWWPRLKRALGAVYLLAVLVLLVNLARELNWSAVLASLNSVSSCAIAGAAFLSVLSHLAYSAFDLTGRSYTGHQISALRVMAITFVSYIGTLNLGSLIGAIGVRQRLYSRSGLSLITIAKVISVSVLTNWLGYLLVGAILLIGPSYGALAGGSFPSVEVVRVFGFALLTGLLVYLLLCSGPIRRSIRLGKVSLTLPSFRLALVQFAISAASWLFNALIIYQLLEGSVRFDLVLLASLAAAVIGLITHIPAGIGVLESTFVLLLGGQVPPETLIAVLLAYRALFYLLPLPVAALLWLRLESAPGVVADDAP